MNQSQSMMETAVKALDAKKAENIKVIDIHEISILGDYFIISNGNNINQIHAMADHVQECMHKEGYTSKQTEGYDHANWILMDYGDVIIHIFDKESRGFYNLERIWSDGKTVSIEP